MNTKQAIYTKEAPEVLGPYSQAVKVGNMVYLSGQIPLNPVNGEIVTDSIDAATHQIFANLTAVAKASGGSLAQMVKLTIFLTDLGHFPVVNSIMAQYFTEPYPARSTVQVSALPKGVAIEIEAIMSL